MLDYQSLLALSVVVQEGSFERAAARLNVTPSAVSQRLKSLEERVGCSLVVRGQPCVPTEIGRRLCLHVDRVQLLEHELLGDIPSIEPGDSSNVQIAVAVNADSLATWFGLALAEFADMFSVLIQVSVDDEGHTSEWLKKGSVLAAVSSIQKPAAGCNSTPLGSMRYVAAASPKFMRRYFPEGVTYESLRAAPSLMFNSKDMLQKKWVRQYLKRDIELPRHLLPSPQAFVVSALSGMGWGMHPESLIEAHLKKGRLVPIAQDSTLDVPLYWHQARAASVLLNGLKESVLKHARRELNRPDTLHVI